MTPHFFYISDIANSSSFNGKTFRKKTMLENFRANVLKGCREFSELVGPRIDCKMKASLISKVHSSSPQIPEIWDIFLIDAHK